MLQQHHIGCSGFSYKEWKSIFYPDGLAQKNWFSFYCNHFNCIEINSSFYRMPPAKSLQKWYAESPAGFLFSMKAPKLITHVKKLHDCKDLMLDFSHQMQQGLREKLGAVLYQLPPSFSFSDERLELLLQQLPAGVTNVVELRHESWWNESAVQKLSEQNIVFCGVSFPGNLSNAVMNNAPVLYYRFHGVPVLYKSVYAMNDVENVAQQILQTGKKAFVFFNNTWGIGALTNAMQMQKML